jgi:hypothetical protein
MRIAIGVNKWKKKARETAFNYKASSKAADSLKERASMMLESSKNQVEGIPLREGLQVRLAPLICYILVSDLRHTCTCRHAILHPAET